ncbi:MAG: hypothetical protein ABUT20_66100 [Bacteroidota bacterium]
MKQSRFTGLLYCTALVIFLTSCGGSDSEKKATADSTATTATDTTAKAPEPAPVVNTVITIPQSMAVIIHKVANFAKWKAAYDADDSARLASGLHNYVIGRGYLDTNMVIIGLKADDIAKAKAFSKNPHLKMAMQKAGVTGAPMVSFTTATWQDTAMISSTLRSRTTYSVKDWDAWLKAFQDGRQERIDNGITDRVVSHDADDNKKIALVTAVMDTAKAFAYYKSDALKKRRAAGGVIGEPTRFLFTIVHRY